MSIPIILVQNPLTSHPSHALNVENMDTSRNNVIPNLSRTTMMLKIHIKLDMKMSHKVPIQFGFIAETK